MIMFLIIEILSNSSLMREHVMHQLIDSTSGEVFLQLLSDEELCYVTTSLLAVIPLPLPIKAILREYDSTYLF